MSTALPGWTRYEDSPMHFVISVCGGGPDIMHRVTALPQAIEPGEWRQPRADWLEADFEAVPLAAWDWLCALHDVVSDADVYLQPRSDLAKRLLICDMDMTIVSAETLDEVAGLLGLGEHISEITARAMRGELDFDSSLRKRIELLAGQPVRIFDEVARSLALNPGARSLLDVARSSGLHTILISGGFEQIATQVAEQLGFDEVYCNRLEIDSGKLTGRIIDPIVNGAFKRDKLIERAAALNIPLEACCAIGDGANDIPMLQAAGLGISYYGKPVLRAATACRIDNTDLTSALAFMGLSY